VFSFRLLKLQFRTNCFGHFHLPPKERHRIAIRNGRNTAPNVVSATNFTLVCIWKDCNASKPC
jgi:hypothetical protein